MATALSELVNTLFATGSSTTSAGVIPTVFAWVTDEDVLPFFAIGIGISLALVGIKIIRKVVWGA